MLLGLSSTMLDFASLPGMGPIVGIATPNPHRRVAESPVGHVLHAYTVAERSKSYIDATPGGGRRRTTHANAIESRMPHLATDRISRGLRWAGTLLLAAGVVLVVGAIGWTQSADALIAASIVSVLAFGLPGAAAFGLAYWFEYVADRLEQSAAAPRVESATAHPENPFREPQRRYALAVAVVAVAWAARARLDTFIPQ